MKKINVTQSTLPSYEDYINRIKPLWESFHLTNSGQYHNELELKLAEYLDTKNALLFSNGHIALEYALEMLHKTGEIITTPFTFASTTQAIVRTGNQPVFCDIKSDFTIDESKIEKLINSNTIAILPVHVYGNICNVEQIEKIAKKHKLFVIYDAAHVFGVKYKNRGIGSYGDISMFSFHATKVFHTIEGGSLTFNNIGYKDKLTYLRNFGQVTSENVDYIGGNGKMDEFRAAMGLCVLEIVDNEISKRKQVYERYMNHLRGLKGIQLNEIQDNVSSNYAYFPVIFDTYHYDRNQIYHLLSNFNITPRKYFYPLTSDFKAYKDLFPIQPTPLAKKMAEQILCLPLYPNLALEDVDRICKIIKEGSL